MWYSFIFNSELSEEPYDAYGDIGYRIVNCDNRIEVNIDNDGNIDFNDGIIGYGYDTDDIRDYKTLLEFLIEHYNEIEEEDNEESVSRHDCINELIAICKENIINESN